MSGAFKVRAVTTFSNSGKRPLQEDHVLANHEKGIFVVADGFGGPQPGSEASKNACEAVKNFLVKEAGDHDATMPFVLRSYFSLAGNVLFNALIHANRKLLNQNKKKNVHEKGGASVLAAFLDGNFLALANVGVCTAYLIRNGQWTELVSPRTFAKLCDPFSREASSSKKIPMMALGISEDLEPEIFEYRLEQGDWLVLTTDGFNGNSIDEIAKIQFASGSVEAGVSQVEEHLKAQELSDNLSLSLAIF